MLVGPWLRLVDMPGVPLQAKAPKQPRRTAKDPEAAAAADAARRQVAGQVARDQHLSVYHAVGKLLHYKRQQPGEQAESDCLQQQQPAAAGAGGSKAAKQQEDGGANDSDVELIDAEASQQEQQANSRFRRAPLQINPEAIIQGSGLEALQVTSFLAENYPHFFADDSIEQAAAAAAYLSDAGVLCFWWAGFHGLRCVRACLHVHVACVWCGTFCTLCTSKR
ncbi:hypothetical protein COO60DRAFT_657908 [Scenedesmus sp. NREL 46B-D3]|nr:hypothetical protein COO60DRAFT_657908 [Scenedesmus sp. NREL 46B-D3]